MRFVQKSTVYGYDDVGNRTSRIDPNAHTTTYQYSLANKLKQELSPAGQKWTYAYDADGNQTTKVTARGNAGSTPATGTITTVFDQAGRVTVIQYGDGITPDVGSATTTPGGW